MFLSNFKKATPKCIGQLYFKIKELSQRTLVHISILSSGTYGNKNITSTAIPFNVVDSINWLCGCSELIGRQLKFSNEPETETKQYPQWAVRKINTASSLLLLGGASTVMTYFLTITGFKKVPLVNTYHIFNVTKPLKSQNDPTTNLKYFRRRK